jgi:predicted choloylglycine hydrolase
VELTFQAIAEPWPGVRWRERFAASWPAYKTWYLRDGDAARPSFAEARARLREHMPELVPAWTRMVELAGGGDLAARMLSLYGTPPLVTGCSQAALPGPVLARNYDFHPALFEGVIAATRFGRRRVIGMSDCLWGLLDGMNDDGLAVSLAFGGRRPTGPGFAMPLVVRYVLETCATVPEAVDALAGIPVQLSYNLTLVDASGAAATARVAPDRPLALAPHPVAANHQGHVEWAEHATAVASVARERRLLELLAEPDLDAFLEPPLLNRDYEHGFGTLYTAIHRPAGGTVEYRWPGARWLQSFDAFAEGELTVEVQPRFSV